MLSKLSEIRLQTCHPDLQRVVRLAAERMKIMVLCGYRDEVSQRAAFANKLSKVNWPNSLHNQTPARAVDIAGLPIDWNDVNRHIGLSKIVLSAAAELSVSLRWGGDWNMNGRTDDEKFRDLVHYELRPNA